MPSPYYPPMSLKKKKEKKRKTNDGMLGVQELTADPQYIAPASTHETEENTHVTIFSLN